MWGLKKSIKKNLLFLCVGAMISSSSSDAVKSTISICFDDPALAGVQAGTAGVLAKDWLRLRSAWHDIDTGCHRLAGSSRSFVKASPLPLHYVLVI